MGYGRFHKLSQSDTFFKCSAAVRALLFRFILCWSWAVFFSFLMSQPSQSFRVGKRGLRLHTDRCLPARSMSIPPAPSPHSPPNSLCSDTAPAALSPCSSSSSHYSHSHCLHFTVSLSTTPRGTHFHLGPVAKGLLIFPDACILFSPSPPLCLHAAVLHEIAVTQECHACEAQPTPALPNMTPPSPAWRSPTDQAILS